MLLSKIFHIYSNYSNLIQVKPFQYTSMKCSNMNLMSSRSQVFKIHSWIINFLIKMRQHTSIVFIHDSSSHVTHCHKKIKWHFVTLRVSMSMCLLFIHCFCLVIDPRHIMVVWYRMSNANIVWKFFWSCEYFFCSEKKSFWKMSCCKSF